MMNKQWNSPTTTPMASDDDQHQPIGRCCQTLSTPMVEAESVSVAPTERS